MLQWSESYELGVEEIDSEHRNMFGFVADVEKAIERGDLDECSALVDRFIEASKTHFANEEKLLVREEYPEITGHCDYHRSLVQRARDLKATCEEEIEAGKIENCYMDMIDLLLDDIVKGDLQIKSYLQDRFNL